MREGSTCRPFLAIKQETCIEYQNLVAPLSHSPKEVLEETFMNGLSPWMKAEARTS